jgi:hypothetical protein
MTIRNLIAGYTTYTDATELSANLGTVTDSAVTTTVVTSNVALPGIDVPATLVSVTPVIVG